MSNSIRDSFNNITDYANENINFLMQSEQNYIIITFVIIFFILFSLISWIYSKLVLQSNACNKLDILYPDSNHYRGRSFFQNNRNVITEGEATMNDEYASIMRSYYIKTAYNCCCIDGYKNNFVALCGLTSCIKQGARCLDFEIYSLNNEPIVAASTANNNYIKETYNYLKFSDVLSIIYNQAFSEHHTTCHYDPLFLNFRIMSTNSTIFNKMGDYIYNILYERRDDHPYFDNNVVSNNNYDGTRFLTGHIRTFFQKIIIMCECQQNKRLITTTKLGKYTNLICDNQYLSKMRFKQIEAIGNSRSPLTVGEAKKKLYIILPDLNNNINNYDYTLALNQGCQFIAMKFQNLDNYLIAYFEFFKENNNFSFRLKHPSLRVDLERNTPNQPITILEQ